MEINPNKISQKERYKLLSASILPRPIAFVSTISETGVPNLAPFSFFSGITSDPPAICFAPNLNPDGSKKDTLINIEETKQFIVHIVSEDIMTAMNKSAANFPADVNEFSEVGLTEAPAKKVIVPRIKEAKICMECRLLQIIEVGSGGFLVIGEVVHFYIADEFWKDGYIDADRLKIIGRWAGYDYIKEGKTFQI